MSWKFDQIDPPYGAVSEGPMWTGSALLPRVLARLPRWRWLAPALRVPGLSHAVAWAWNRKVDQRRAQRGRQPFQDRF